MLIAAGRYLPFLCGGLYDAGEESAVKIIDCSPRAIRGDGLSLFERIGGTLSRGFSGDDGVEARETAAVMLQKFLDDRYSLIQSFQPPDLDVTIPVVLIGPPGVYVIYPSQIKGSYRASGEAWLVEGPPGRFNPVQPNLVQRASLMAGAVRVYLEHAGFPFPKIEPVLAFTNLNLRVESENAPVRIVSSEAFDRFATSLTQTQVALGPENARKLIGCFTHPPVVKEEPETPAPARRAAARRLPFSRDQLLLLGLMALAEVLLLIAFAVYLIVAA